MKRQTENNGECLFEALEPRMLMSGDVAAAVTGLGELRVTGDSNDNSIVVADLGHGEFSLRGLAGTTVNGEAEFRFGGVTRGMRFNMRAGNDTISFGNAAGTATTIEGDVQIDMWSGRDLVLFGMDDASGARVCTGTVEVTGNISIEQSRSSALHSSIDVFMAGITVGGDVTIDLGRGNTGTREFVMHRWAPFATYEELGRVRESAIRVNTIKGDLSVTAEAFVAAGPIDVYLDSVSVKGQASIFTSYGNDTIQLTRVNVRRDLTINGGMHGSDYIAVGYKDLTLWGRGDGEYDYLGQEGEYKGLTRIDGDLEIATFGGYNEVHVNNAYIRGDTGIYMAEPSWPFDAGYRQQVTFGKYGDTFTGNLHIMRDTTDNSGVNIYIGGLHHAYIWKNLFIGIRTDGGTNRIQIDNSYILDDVRIMILDTDDGSPAEEGSVDDYISIRNTQVWDYVKVEMGSGNDVLRVDSSVFRGYTEFWGGAGDDVMYIGTGGANTFHKTAFFGGEKGEDTLHGSPANVFLDALPALVFRFEHVFRM